MVQDLLALEEAARRAIRLDDIDTRAGEFLVAFSNRLLSTVDGSVVHEKEAKEWLKAASVLTSSPDEAESARVRAVAQSPVGTGSFRTFAATMRLVFAKFSLQLLGLGRGWIDGSWRADQGLDL